VFTKEKAIAYIIYLQHLFDSVMTYEFHRTCISLLIEP
jgi:hypothetical protein